MKIACLALLCISVSVVVVYGQMATQPQSEQPAQLPAGSAAPAYETPVYGPPAPPYPPAYPYPYSYSSTAAEGAMNGMANVISSKGNYNLSTSEAAVNMTQAQKNEIQNHQTYENTYFQMKETNQAYQKAHAKPRLMEEQLARLAREGLPQPVSPGEVNPISGKINWPAVLQEDSFAAGRTELEELSAQKASCGSLSISDQMAARKTIESMFADLKSQIREVPTYDYLASRTFLRSMIYALAHSDLQ